MLIGYNKGRQMKRKAESEFDVDSITEMMKESNMFDQDDEYKFLLEGYLSKWEDQDSMERHLRHIDILGKAISRYNRYVRNINFGEYSYIEDMLIKFLHEYETRQQDENTIKIEQRTIEAMKTMSDIDGEILQVIRETDLVDKMEGTCIDVKKRKIKKGF